MCPFYSLLLLLLHWSGLHEHDSKTFCFLQVFSKPVFIEQYYRLSDFLTHLTFSVVSEGGVGSQALFKLVCTDNVLFDWGLEPQKSFTPKEHDGRLMANIWNLVGGDPWLITLFQRPKLYTYYRSSCAWRVRIALNIAGMEVDMEPIHLVKWDCSVSYFSDNRNLFETEMGVSSTARSTRRSIPWSRSQPWLWTKVS